MKKQQLETCLSHFFSWERVSLELAQGLSRVALAWHKAGCSTPFAGNNIIGDGRLARWARLRSVSKFTVAAEQSGSFQGSCSLRFGVELA